MIGHRVMQADDHQIEELTKQGRNGQIERQMLGLEDHMSQNRQKLLLVNKRALERCHKLEKQ